MASKIEALFREMQDAVAQGQTPETILQHLATELMSNCVVSTVIGQIWAQALTGFIVTKILNTDSTSGKAKTLGLICLSHLAKVRLVISSGSSSSQDDSASETNDRIFAFRQNILLPSILEIKEPTEEWLDEREGISQEGFGLPLGRQHEHMLAIMLRATSYDVLWAYKQGGSILPARNSNTAAVVASKSLTARDVLVDLCHNKDKMFLKLVVSILKMNRSDLLMVEACTRLLYELTLPGTHVSIESSVDDEKLEIFQVLIDSILEHCLQMSILDTLCDELLGTMQLPQIIPKNWRKDKSKISESLIWCQCVVHMCRMVLNTYDFTTNSKAAIRWKQTLIPSGTLRSEQQYGSFTAAALVRNMVPILLEMVYIIGYRDQHRDKDSKICDQTSTRRDSCQSRYIMVESATLGLLVSVFYWALNFLSVMFLNTPSDGTDSVLAGLKENIVNDALDVFATKFVVRLAADLIIENINSREDDVVDVTGQFVVTEGHLRRILFEILRVYINIDAPLLSHATELLDTIVSLLDGYGEIPKARSAAIVRRVFVSVYDDLLGCTNGLCYNHMYDAITGHLLALLTGMCRDTTTEADVAPLSIPSDSDNSGGYLALGAAKTDNNMTLLPNGKELEESENLQERIQNEGNAQSSNQSNLINNNKGYINQVTQINDNNEGSHLINLQTPFTLTTTLPSPGPCIPSTRKEANNIYPISPNEDDNVQLTVTNALKRARRKDKTIPKHLCCMWSGQLMREPVRLPVHNAPHLKNDSAACDGDGDEYVFDMSSLEQVFSTVGFVNPLTGEQLDKDFAAMLENALSLGLTNNVVDRKLQKEIVKFKLSRKKCQFSV